jgi:DNA sulfur modification protein DndE
MDFKRIKLSESSTNKLRLFKSRTKLTPNIACRIALSLSMVESTPPDLDLFSSEGEGQEINRYTLFGEHELVLLALFKEWCIEKKIEKEKYYDYFIANINRGIELLVNRVKGLEDLNELLPNE